GSGCAFLCTSSAGSCRKRAARITSRPCAVSVTRCATPPNPRRRRSAPEHGLRRYSPFVALLGVVTTGAEAAYTRAMRDGEQTRRGGRHGGSARRVVG